MSDFNFPLYPKRNTSNSIGSILSLSQALDIDEKYLLDARNISLEERYRSFPLPKKDGSSRIVYDPDIRIRHIQSRINSRIFCVLIDWPDYIFGSLSNEIFNETVFCRDYIACAQQHCQAKSLIKIDISNFFDNIHKDFVYEIFSELLKFPKEVSAYLTDICCYGEFLIQGALTSSYIATLCFWNVEGDVVKKLRRKGLIYTRLVDDITISSKNPKFNFSNAEQHVYNMLIDKDLPINESKKVIQRVGIAPMHVHGLRINYDTPRLPSDEVKRIRASVHNVVKMAKVNNYRTSLSYRKMYDRSMGRVNKLARVGHNKHEELKNKLLKVIPLPSIRDIEATKRALSVLETIEKYKISTRKYVRKFYLAQYRISIVKRSFKNEASELKNRLEKIRPNLKVTSK